jgi:hypothetical protein
MSVGLEVCLRRPWARPRSVYLSQGVQLQLGVFRAEPDVRLHIERSDTTNLRQRMLLYLRVT